MTHQGALTGLKVLDLSRVLAGPWCTQMLGDMGAEVIKIERPESGDETRTWGPPFFEEQSAYFLAANRNKKSVAIDFNNTPQLTKLKELAIQADVIVENFRPGKLSQFGLDYDSLKAKNPNLVYCTIEGFGDGPYKNKTGYDAIIQAMAGLMSITGSEPDQPTKVGVAISDLLTGLYACSAILAAIHYRQRSGSGQRVTVSLFDAQVAGLANVAMNFLVSGKNPTPMGNAHPNIVPYQTFSTKDQPMMIAIGNDTQFSQFCRCLEVHWYEDVRFCSNPQRLKNRQELVQLIQKRLSKKTLAEWSDQFSEASFPYGPVQSLQQLKSDEHVIFRDLFTTMDDGKTPCLRNPMRFTQTPIKSYSSPPQLGEHQSDGFCKD